MQKVENFRFTSSIFVSLGKNLLVKMKVKHFGGKKGVCILGWPGPGIWAKYFLLFPQKKHATREKLINDKIDQNTNFAKLPCAKCLFFGITLSFIIQKMKTKQIVYLSFLWWQVFLREWEKIFYTYSRSEWSENANFSRSK